MRDREERIDERAEMREARERRDDVRRRGSALGEERNEKRGWMIEEAWPQSEVFPLSILWIC